MALRVGINGFGRMGRLVMRAAWDWPDVEFVHINEPAGDCASLAHLLSFDSVHGRWRHEAVADAQGIAVDGRSIGCTHNDGIADTGWSQCDLVLEASGACWVWLMMLAVLVVFFLMVIFIKITIGDH